MVFIRVCLVALVSLYYSASNAQECCENIESIISNIYNDSYQKVDGDELNGKIVVVLTQKTCLNCLTDIQIYLNNNFPNSDIAFLSFIPENPLLFEKQTALIHKYYKTKFKSYFYFFDYEKDLKVENEKVLACAKSISPFLIYFRN